MQVKQLPELQGQKRLAVVFGPGEEMIRGLADLAKIRSIAGGLEVVLVETPASLRRCFDAATGLALLDLSDPPR